MANRTKGSLQAQKDVKENLRETYRAFLKEKESSKKAEAGRELVRAIFGKDAIAEDSLL